MKKGLMLFVVAAIFSLNAFAQEIVDSTVPAATLGVIERLTFNNADITVVLQAIAQKATKDGRKVNITYTAEVKGMISVTLEGVDWETALETVVKIGGYGYEWIGKDRNIVLVDTLENLATMRAKDAEAKVAEPLETITYRLKYLDAYDVKKILTNQLTSRGKITVMELEAQKGWKSRGGYSAGGGSSGSSSAGDFGKAERESGARPRTRTIIITDTKSNINNLVEAMKSIDIMPQQVLIEAKIMEVSEDKLKDIGLDWGTGSSVDDGTMTVQTTSKKGASATEQVGVINLGAQATPAMFGPMSSDVTGIWPFNSGTSLLYQKLSSTQLQILLHALEEDAKTNTLSSPRIITLDGQEAYIMVGERRPIIKSEISSSQTSVGISKNLNYYQNLGIELNVVPQVCDENRINLTIYPSVTSSSQNTPAQSQISGATSTDYYPVILVRETQTQILVNSGETVVIGGLLKDVTSEGVTKTPILGDIPFLGKLFQRTTKDTGKIDLVIFITAKIIDLDKDLKAKQELEAAQVNVSVPAAAEAVTQVSEPAAVDETVR